VAKQSIESVTAFGSEGKWWHDRYKVAELWILYRIGFMLIY
jgi:hypothetical protein